MNYSLKTNVHTNTVTHSLLIWKAKCSSLVNIHQIPQCLSSLCLYQSCNPAICLQMLNIDSLFVWAAVATKIYDAYSSESGIIPVFTLQNGIGLSNTNWNSYVWQQLDTPSIHSSIQPASRIPPPFSRQLTEPRLASTSRDLAVAVQSPIRDNEFRYESESDHDESFV